MHLTLGKQRLLIGIFDALMLLLLWQRDAILQWMLGPETQCFLLKNGVICPACGGTRCAFYLASGAFAKAFVYHPVLFCLFFYLVALAILWNAELLFQVDLAKKLRRWMTDYRVVIAIALCYVVVGLSRNFIGDWSHLYQ